jgi:hypothetical protein
VQAGTQREVSRKLAQLRRLRVPDTTVGTWTRTGLAILERELKPATVRTYRTHIRYLSLLAGLALDRVTPEQLEATSAQLTHRGVRAATIQSVHRTFRACLAEAVRRGRLEQTRPWWPGPAGPIIPRSTPCRSSKPEPSCERPPDDQMPSDGHWR